MVSVFPGSRRTVDAASRAGDAGSVGASAQAASARVSAVMERVKMCRMRPPGRGGEPEGVAAGMPPEPSNCMKSHD